MSIAKNRIVIVATLVAAVAIGIALAGVTSGKKFPAQQLQAELAAATLYPQDFRPLEGFRLIDHNGEPFDNNRLAGHWSLLFFGFTYCPDVCPLTMQVLQNVNQELSASGSSIIKPQIVFVSVDPERDTPERLRQYVAHFNPDFTAVSGDHENLQTLTRSLGAFYAKVDPSQHSAHYQVDHSASLFLLGPDGRIRALFSAPHQVQAIAHDLLTIIQQG